MIEAMIINYLIRQNVESVNQNVFAEVPEKNIPENYILIEKLGSGEIDEIYHPSVSIESISKNSLLKAMEINEIVKNEMKSFRDDEDVYACKLNSDFNDTNPATKEYRYKSIFDIFM